MFKVGISGENYYEVLSGLEKEQMIVVGGYKALSKLLNHGDLVKIRDWKNNLNIKIGLIIKKMGVLWV